MALHVLDEANRCLQCKNPQCQKGCPINTPIPEVIRLLKENNIDPKKDKTKFYTDPDDFDGKTGTQKNVNAEGKYSASYYRNEKTRIIYNVYYQNDSSNIQDVNKTPKRIITYTLSNE